MNKMSAILQQLVGSGFVKRKGSVNGPRFIYVPKGTLRNGVPVFSRVHNPGRLSKHSPKVEKLGNTARLEDFEK